LQFDRAEDDVAAGAAPATVARSCAGCGNPITDRYFTVQGKIMCPACHGRIMAAINERFATGSFWMALAHGSGAAILGAVIYYGVIAITNIRLAPVAILVGYLVGKGVAKGAHNKGGFGYQALAVGLTYISVALTALPEVAKMVDKAHDQGSVHLVAAVFLVMFSPFFMAYTSPLSAVINGFAFWEAWKLNRTPKLDITGPHIVKSAEPIVLDPPPPHVG
jgi:hypothetical protein